MGGSAVDSQLSPVAILQSCMSLQRFGTTKETVGRVVKSDGQEAYVLSWAASAVAVQSASGLCLRA